MGIFEYGRVHSRARVYSGACADHSIIVSQAGEIFGIGSNAYGHLGIGHTKDVAKPEKVHVFTDSQGISIRASCGSYHTLFLTSDGQVYGCGLNSDLQLGLATNSSWIIPTHVYKLATTEIVQISCGGRWSICLDSIGRVHEFHNGKNSISRFNRGRLINHGYSVFQLPFGLKITFISAGYGHYAALAEDGTINTIGNNDCGQLGRRISSDVSRIYDYIRTEKRVIHAMCGTYSTILVDADLLCYCFGANEKGSLGIGSDEDQMIPVSLDAFRGMEIKKMSMGGNHSIVLTESGVLYGFGGNFNHELCLNHEEDVFEPVMLPFNAIFNSEIKDIACGSNHTIFITEEGNCYGVGYGPAFGDVNNVTEPLLLLEANDLGPTDEISNDLRNCDVFRR